MKLRQPKSSRWAPWSIWVFAAALLLNSAMPWLASASAQMQGKTLVEVCTVYGVAVVAQEGQTTDPAPLHPVAHAGSDCALTALAAFAPVDPPAITALTVPRGGASPPHAHPSSQAPDACAAWVARRKHGPPALA